MSCHSIRLVSCHSRRITRPWCGSMRLSSARSPPCSPPCHCAAASRSPACMQASMQASRLTKTVKNQAVASGIHTPGVAVFYMQNIKTHSPHLLIGGSRQPCKHTPSCKQATHASKPHLYESVASSSTTIMISHSTFSCSFLVE